MSILIKTARISGFRGLENIEVSLAPTTVLTGMNNSGKTSFLKALQIALGNRQFISQDDFFIKNNKMNNEVYIDLLIVPMDESGNDVEDFSEDWEILFTTDRIRTDGVKSYLPLRTVVSFDAVKNSFKSQSFILQNWPEFESGSVKWFQSDNGSKTIFRFDEFPFFYMDAQRDILEDTKMRTSYIGKMLSKIEYSEEDITEIEDQIQHLNEKAVNSSEILKNLKKTLKELDGAMGSGNEGIDITPFTKKLRDLSKGLTIYYSQEEDSYSMEYHGMGTRSWSSLLTLKSYINLLGENSKSIKSVFFPILAIEEPEAHLHPNAQKKLYSQISSIKGQTIISTHSPYIAATANIREIRSFYKSGIVSSGSLDVSTLNSEEIRKIKRQVINTRGEIFFSKVLIFFEGETEEQALPIFFEKFFSCSPVELGVDFVGVCGFKNYLPFIRFADSMNIPWLILSDAEQEVVASIPKQLKNSKTQKVESDVIVYLDSGKDFERQLIDDGFHDEIRSSIASCDEYKNEQHRAAKEPQRLTEINGYTDQELYDIMTKDKTKYSPIVAEKIIESGKALPQKVIELFEKISDLVVRKENLNESEN